MMVVNVWISSNVGKSKTIEREKELDAWAEATNFCNEQYARLKGPDDPARTIREE